MKINVVVVGDLKEKYLVEACKEYLKRISRFHTIEVITITEEKLPKTLNEADVSKALVKEGAKIEKYLKFQPPHFALNHFHNDRCSNSNKTYE